MNCQACGSTISKFDVHCRSCGARIDAPPVETQLENLGISIDKFDAPSPERGGGKSSARAATIGAAAITSGLFAGVSYFVSALVGGALPGPAEVRTQATIERAIRNSKD